MITIAQRLRAKNERWRTLLHEFAARMRVALPGIITAFDASRQTVKVRCAIRETINISGVPTDIEIPLLVDVPIVMPRAGGFVLTLPVAAGDECLVLFSDLCIDAWWQSGGVQNRMNSRRHDLSDACALLGIWSQPRKLTAYSTDSAQLRNDAGDIYVEIDTNGKARIQATDIELHATHSYKWDVFGFGQSITHDEDVHYTIRTWQQNAIVTSISQSINQPEGP